MLQQLVRQTMRLLFPVTCDACGEPLGGDPVPFFCHDCWSLIRPFEGPSCPRCHKPFASASSLVMSPTHECRQCRTSPPAYSQAWAPYPYCPPLQEAIALFKFRGKVGLAGALGRLLIEALPPTLVGDLVIPVPLHPDRLRNREFNQSLLLADRIATHLALPLDYRSLVRIRDTAPQTTLTRTARLQNMRSAFAVPKPSRISGKRILLVDDVLTTGTTANACAKVLLKAGAADVTLLALARSVDQGMIPDIRLPPSAFNQRSLGDN
ncbi:MAG: ComF family protein [Nitrospiraceae bacterium]